VVPEAVGSIPIIRPSKRSALVADFLFVWQIPSTIVIMTTVLISGSYGREFELGRVFLESELDAKVHYANGNGAMQYPYLDAQSHDIPDTAEALAHLAYDLDADLAIVSAEAQLQRNFAGALQEVGIATFGPNSESALHETSKAYGADFCERHVIAKPKHAVAESIDEAIAEIQGRAPEEYAIKADGTAGGKGVFLPKTEKESRRVLHQLMISGAYNGSGLEKVVIQERFHGPEVSMFIVMDGKGGYSILPYVQDHKRIGEGDTGPNTGGVGSYLPVDKLLSVRQKEKLAEIAKQSVEGMEEDSTSYAGLLYVGTILAEERGGDPAVIEFNTRWGDPETETLMPVLQQLGIDPLQMHLSAVHGELLLPQDLTQTDIAAITVTLSRDGYPIGVAKESQPIYGLDRVPADVLLQFAGVVIDGQDLRAAGGRVVHLTALAETLEAAAKKVYGAIGRDKGVYFEGMQYRHDIGHLLRPNWRKATIRG
jgi:phosphoribosylamine--glycine ligase